MILAVRILQWAVTGSFVLLGLLTVRDWLRHQDRRRAYLALAIGLLGVVSLLGQLRPFLSNGLNLAVAASTVVLLMASAYALLQFRGTFIPISRTGNALAIVAAIVSSAVLVAVLLPATNRQSPTVTAASALYVLVWAAIVGEPIVRFWRASIGRPAVQRARLRGLSAGFGLLVFILLVAVAAGSASTNPVFQILLQVIALATVPLLYAGFAPPRWLRRAWREPEEEALRRAVRELLLFSPDRRALAGRALDWGRRLMGAEGGAIIEGDEVLAAQVMDPGLALRLSREAGTGTETVLLALSVDGIQEAVVVPLLLENNTRRGTLLLISSAFTPLFGSDEILRIEQFAINVMAGLDRVRVTERLADLERTKSQFLNLASHELRTPLSVIRGYVSILETGQLGTLTPAGRKAVSLLSGKGLEMNMLIEQMLEAARLEEGRLALRPETLNLGDVAATAVEQVRPLTDAAHPIVLEGDRDPVWVKADRDRVTTILINLLDNGIKYSPQGGEIRCRVSGLDGTGVVAVQDQGIGIAESDMATLFTRFGRVVTPGSEHIKGTGLGLWLSRELSRQQGGDLTVESEPGAGSTFTLRLPAVPHPDDAMMRGTDHPA